MQKIIPNLWFSDNAEEAANFYTSVFSDGAIHSKTYYTEAGFEIHGMPAGTVLTIEFEVEGYRFTALNGGPHFTPNPSISFIVSRTSPDEIDALWEKLADGGTPLMPLDAYPFSKRYGWIQDKFGISWQLILPGQEGDWRPSLVPSLLFTKQNDGRAEEAMDFYTSVFEESKMGNLFRHGPDQNMVQEGYIMYADFMLLGQWFAAMDGGPAHDFSFNEAISLSVACRDQDEIDRYFTALSAVPEAEQCGWLKDTFGVSWQIVPEGIEAMLNDPDKEKANRRMAAMLSMKKLDIAALKNA